MEHCRAVGHPKALAQQAQHVGCVRTAAAAPCACAQCGLHSSGEPEPRPQLPGLLELELEAQHACVCRRCGPGRGFPEGWTVACMQHEPWPLQAVHCHGWQKALGGAQG